MPAKIVRTAAAPFLITALAICQAGCASDSNVYYAKEPAVAAYVAKASPAEVKATGCRHSRRLRCVFAKCRTIRRDPIAATTVVQILRLPMQSQPVRKNQLEWRRPPFPLTCQPTFAGGSSLQSTARTRLLCCDTLRSL